MGTLRLLLALSLVLTHTEAFAGREFTIGFNAVQIFFSVSGLFIAMVLSQKYERPGGWASFYKARLLRVFPVYWMVVLLCLATYLIIYFTLGAKTGLASWITYASTLTPLTLAALIWANVGLLGQGLLFFSAVDPHTGSLYFSIDPSAQALPAWSFLMVPQAWFLDFMFWLYLLAPVLNRLKTPALIAVACCGFFLRFLVYVFGLPVDPWIMRFVPYQMAFFIVGMLCWRIVDAVNLDDISKTYKWACALGYGLLFLGMEYLEGEFTRSVASISLLLLGAPFIFSLSHRSKADRLMGEWSLIVFLTHGAIINAVVSLGGKNVLSPVVIVLSLLCSAVLTRYVMPYLPGMSTTSPNRQALKS